MIVVAPATVLFSIELNEIKKIKKFDARACRVHTSHGAIHKHKTHFNSFVEQDQQMVELFLSIRFDSMWPCVSVCRVQARVWMAFSKAKLKEEEEEDELRTKYKNKK